VSTGQLGMFDIHNHLVNFFSGSSPTVFLLQAHFTQDAARGATDHGTWWADKQTKHPHEKCYNFFSFSFYVQNIQKNLSLSHFNLFPLPLPTF
jgi:hypothetical protein